MKAAIAAFTDEGVRLASQIAERLSCDVFAPASHQLEGTELFDEPIAIWTAKRFASYDAFIFVSACGIAVRAIASCVSNKLTDPAVVVIDEAGRYVIPILSGHVGGGNALALELAAMTGGEAVITTATDIQGKPAVDVWAKEYDFAIENKDAIKHVSAAVLQDRQVGVAVTSEIIEAPFPVTLFLRPRNLVLGVGCKRDTTLVELQSAVDDFLAGAGVSALSLYAVASIDIKRNEAALVKFCKRHVLDFCCYSAEELGQAEGSVSPSERVLNEVGVDNVCERASLLCSGGVLLRSKTVYSGITLALCRRDEVA